MPKPTIEEILRVGFESAGELSPLRSHNWNLSWSDDPDGDTAIIRHFVGIAQGPALLPYEIRAWAFDELQKRARHCYDNGGMGRVHGELVEWSFLVFIGVVERPKRPKGRYGRANMIRNRMIVDAVAWLQRHGETKETAMELVAKAVDPTGRRFKAGAVREVLKSGDPVQDWKKEIEGFLFP